ncbi:uncharacterized protein LOC123193082, partial [Mangifera indica]|uniref:uncharacterized protein LOC123193082 n=1 Tax=Mangifera indica TaxID=29780 RepID=UPI001CF9AF3A
MRAWKSYGLENVMSSNGFVVFRFKEEEDVHRVLEEGPWMFGGKHMVLQQWHAHTSFDMNRISKVPVWVRLHGVPLLLWTQRGLSTVSSVVGRPLSYDKQTYECTRLSYTHVCVELDAKKTPLQKFEIQCCLSSDPIEVKMEYEWKPKRCAKCGLFSHNCQPKEKETKPKEGAQAASSGLSSSTEKGKAVATDTRVIDEAKTDSQATARQAQTLEIKAIGKKKFSKRGEERRDTEVGPLAVVLVADQTQGNFSDSDSDPDSPIAIEEDQDGLLGIGECVLNRSASLSESPNRFVVLDRSKSLATTSKTLDSSSKAVVPPLVTSRTRARSNRRQLWDSIRSHSQTLNSSLWLVMEDFNAILRSSYRVGGDTGWYSHMDDFVQCIHDVELVQLPYKGLRYTWHNGEQGEGTILKKLDWFFCSSSWVSTWPNSESEFLTRDASDHSAMEIVQRVWETPIEGNSMFHLTKKLHKLKGELKCLHIRDSGHISSRVREVKGKWAEAQEKLDRHPMSIEHVDLERDLARQYYSLCKDKEAFYKQRSRVQWLRLGDQNTKFFHKSLIHRQVRNRVRSLWDGNAVISDQRELGNLAVQYYKDLLTAPSRAPSGDVSRYFSRHVSEHMHDCLIAPVTDMEIKDALFSILDDKSAGPDSFTSLFFKRTWDIIGADFRAAVRWFFSTSRLPRCVNTTRIALVPKVESPRHMGDFRPISCCNVLYKCISKWIETCMTTPHFSVALNGDLHGFFSSSRGVRQGDPLSPYLFVLAMEGLAGILQKASRVPDAFSVGVIKSSLDEFARVSSLVTNPEKSYLFLSGPLIERILARIRLWTSSSLTYAGCLQLIKSVLFSIQVYWSSMFILPSATMRKIEGILPGFLWSGTSLSHLGAKVAWASVCYPLREGGLRIKRCKDWNKAAVLKHVWRLLIDHTSIWSSWVHRVVLRGRSFWHVRVPSGGRLCDLFSFRVLSATSLAWDAKVFDIIRDGVWAFPRSCSELQQVWDSIRIFPRVGNSDHLVWRGHSSGRFSIDSAWDLIRPRRDVNSIHHLLWFSGHIQRHSFILWLATLGRLRTMDCLQHYGIVHSAVCVLCGKSKLGLFSLDRAFLGPPLFVGLPYTSGGGRTSSILFHGYPRQLRFTFF